MLTFLLSDSTSIIQKPESEKLKADRWFGAAYYSCLLYTSDAADERSSVDLGGRRIIKKKNTEATGCCDLHTNSQRH